MGDNATHNLYKLYGYTKEQVTQGYRGSPFDVPRNTHITIGVFVGVMLVVAIVVAVWCLKPCATHDRRMKNASTATSIASI